MMRSGNARVKLLVLMVLVDATLGRDTFPRWPCPRIMGKRPINFSEIFEGSNHCNHESDNRYPKGNVTVTIRWGILKETLERSRTVTVSNNKLKNQEIEGPWELSWERIRTESQTMEPLLIDAQHPCPSNHKMHIVGIPPSLLTDDDDHDDQPGDIIPSCTPVSYICSTVKDDIIPPHFFIYWTTVCTLFRPEMSNEIHNKDEL